MNDIVAFVNKTKFVLNALPEEEIDTYNDMYNDMPTEEFVVWINKKYEEYSNIINKLNEVLN
jgi:hypothetical protein